MPNKEKNITPLQEIMNTVESSISGFGLPPLPPLSKLIPPGNREEPEKVKEPVAPIVEEKKKEVDKREEVAPDITDTHGHSGEYTVYNCSKRRETPIPASLKKELRIRDVFVRQSPPDEMKK